MIAVVVFSIGLLGSASSITASMRQQRLTTSRIEMVSLADAKIDELRTIGQTPLGDPLRSRLNVGGSLTMSLSGYTDVVLNADGRFYRRRWLITADATGARRVNIRVEPTGVGNYYWRRVDFTTLVAF